MVDTYMLHHQYSLIFGLVLVAAALLAVVAAAVVAASALINVVKRGLVMTLQRAVQQARLLV
jgi:hypothetical protein